MHDGISFAIEILIERDDSHYKSLGKLMPRWNGKRLTAGLVVEGGTLKHKVQQEHQSEFE